jgi:NTE family protein
VSTATRTAFVFAGGSSLGAIQVGMLKALVAAGWTADLVVGSSVGAINAAYFASDPTRAGVERLEAVWRSVRRTDIFPVTRMRGLFALLAKRGYLVHADGLAALLEANLPVRRLEQTRLPCHIVATDLLEGSEVVLSSGAATEALLASAAIPGVFPPVRIGGRYLVDGGVASHTPISAAIELGATRLVILPTGYSCTLAEPPRNAIGVALHGLNLRISRHLVNAIRHYRQLVEIVIVPPLCPLNVSPYDFTNALKLIDRAHGTTEHWLRHGGEQIDGVPHEMPLHSHRDVP